MDFGDLTDDQKIQEQLTKFNNAIRQLDEMLQNEMVINNGNIENITTKERADYNLFMAYSLNTLHWLHLRSVGIDPSKSEVKEQMNRIRQYMIDAKMAHERNTIRPHLNVDVARRFIQHGVERFPGEHEPPAKRKRE